MNSQNVRDDVINFISLTEALWRKRCKQAFINIQMDLHQCIWKSRKNVENHNGSGDDNSIRSQARVNCKDILFKTEKLIPLLSL